MDQMTEQHLKSPYLGAPVDQMTMPHGAFVNQLMGEVYGKRRESKIRKIGKRITVLERFFLENSVIIEGENSVIFWDTGSNMGIGKKKYQLLRQITDKPVRAIIYSHSHYTNGARAFVPEGEEGKSIEIIGHPDIHKNCMNSGIELGPAFSRNIAQHFGMMLPRTGPDAAPINYEGGDGEDKSSGYIRPTYEIKHEEELTIDGVRMQFFYSPSDANDSITLWLPDDDTVITNSILSSLPNMYTLRGQPYRDPVMWMNGIDNIRRINPTYLVPEHGEVMITKEDSYELATAYRDSIAFIYSQTIRGINKGLKPDEIAESVKLPEHLAKHPRLTETYLELKHHVKGVYSGLIGWFSIDAADINPVPRKIRAQKLIQGFGGMDRVVNSAEESLVNKEYAWAAELINYVLAVAPNHEQAKQIKADALRQMAYVTPASSSRNFYLTQAYALEGKIDFNQIPAGFSPVDEKRIGALPIEEAVRVLQYRIDPIKSGGTDAQIELHFIDKNETLGLCIRKGVAECVHHALQNPTYSLSIQSSDWYGLIFKRNDLSALLSSGRVKLTGDPQALIEILDMFE
ncbi:alkyl sulfatase dimerization domain-containing protein [Neobacillus niacini]|uniref:alkyl sulfatase dimerization domain-containing protein n=1 Tax=Neobacillus niacini TaxID=86668 RepID=UPI0021CB0A3D|nr:alkyl sulfatase dimerization domain-containing protein [Neobacillus niacini]MCM3767728.1 MBL fold metallo-hydrolase [Neobacillus niacini]